MRTSRTNLHHFQYDFLEFRIRDVDQTKINWNNFKPHPALNSYYTFKDSELFEKKRFGLFVSSGNSLTIRTSIPYLVNGHNYIGMDEQELTQIITALSETVGLDLFKAEVIKLEYGAYEFISDSCRHYISQVIGIKDYDIEKSDDLMKMFGDGKHRHYKIYDAVANAKAKKTYTKGNYPLGKLIKHELKFTNVKKTLNSSLTVYDLCKPEVKATLHSMLLQHHEQLCFQKHLTIKPVGSSFSDMLYAGLKQMEQDYGEYSYKLIGRIIDSAELTPSQKSKRRKTLLELETAYNQG